MSEFENLIRRSMEQTTDAQGMVRKLLGHCESLMNRVNELEAENKVLREQLR